MRERNNVHINMGCASSGPCAVSGNCFQTNRLDVGQISRRNMMSEVPGEVKVITQHFRRQRVLEALTGI